MRPGGCLKTRQRLIKHTAMLRRIISLAVIAWPQCGAFGG
jgi:hypothetical protein